MAQEQEIDGSSLHINKIGKYLVEKKIGRGANGDVFKGFDPEDTKIVALKTIRKDFLDNQEDKSKVLKRFKREADSAIALEHPNIVKIYEYNEDEEQAFIAMEYLEGKDLKNYFDEKYPFTLDQIVNLQTQLLDALGFSHQYGIVHRDVKPSNIVLLSLDLLKVTDFGIAKTDDSDLTKTGTIIGTPSYMSPEQLQGRKVDGRADLFSAGVILYQFLTGDKPFMADSLATLAIKILKDAPIPPSEVKPKIPIYFDFVVQKALAKNPAKRYQTAKDFISALKAAHMGDLPANHADSIHDKIGDIDEDGLELDMLDVILEKPTSFF